MTQKTLTFEDLMNFKSLHECLKEAENQNPIYALNGFDNNRYLALTKFALWLEATAKSKNIPFKIISIKPSKVRLLIRRAQNSWEKNEYSPNEDLLIGDCFGNFFSCIFGDYYYYFEMDDNPFFGCKYGKFKYSLEKPKEESGSSYLSNWKVYQEIENVYRQDEYIKIFKNMIEGFDELNITDTRYIKVIDGQNIYVY